MSGEREAPSEFELLQAAYQRVANTQEGGDVLADLAKFCGADADCFDESSVRQTDYNLGKRRVWLRIQRMLRGEPEKKSAISAEDAEGRELAPGPEE